MKKKEIIKKSDLSFIAQMTNKEKMAIRGGKTAEARKIGGEVAVTGKITF